MANGSIRLGALAAACVVVPLLTVVSTRKRYPVPPPDSSAVLITGTSSGIGRDAALRLANEGFTVFAGVRDLKQAPSHANIIPVRIELADSDSIKLCAEEVTRELTARQLSLGGLINNAAVGRYGPLEFTSLEELRNMFQVNVFGGLELTQRLLPLLRQSHGRIVFVSSSVGIVAAPRLVHYSMTKAALKSMADGLRVELSPFQVSVSLLYPGVIKSAIQAKTLETMQSGLEAQESNRVYPVSPNFLEGLRAAEASADGPSVTSDAILRALKDPYPKTSYFAGKAAGLPVWITPRLQQFLPERVMDELLLKWVG